MNKTQTVLLIVDQIRNGGAEKILLDFQKDLEERGYNTIVFTLYGIYKNARYGLLNNSRNIILKIFQQIILFIKIQLFVIRHKPDCIFSFLERSNIITELLPFGTKNKIITVHNLLSIQYEKIKNKKIKHLTYKIINKCYNKKSKIIAVSSQVKNDLVLNFKIIPSKIRTINNSIDKVYINEQITKEIDEIKIDTKSIYILNIGRFTKQKAQWKLIKAMYLLKLNQKINIKLILIGQGELDNQIKALIKKLNLNEDIHIIKHTSNPYKFMNISSLLVLPSLYEGFPIVLSEAAACSLPVIGSEEAIPQEIFENKNIWLSYVYKNKRKEENFSIEIEEDDIELYKLIEKTIEKKSLKTNWMKDIENWERLNNKEKQFDSYIRVINDNRY